MLLVLLFVSGCATATNKDYVTAQQLASMNYSYSAVIDRLTSRVSSLEEKLDKMQKSSSSIRTPTVSTAARIIHLTIPSMQPVEQKEETTNTTTVRRGETFRKIAKRVGIPLNHLMRLNPQFDMRMMDDGYVDHRRPEGDNWDPDYLEIGDKIFIP